MPGMVELSQSQLFNAKSLPAHRREPCVAQQFDGNLAADVCAFSKVDYAHSTFAQKSQQPIGPDLALHQRRQRSEIEHRPGSFIQA